MPITISSKAPFKSLSAINPAISLPDFTVLTGLNGVGKTHLLLGMSKDSENAKNPIEASDQGVRITSVRFADASTLSPKAAKAVAVSAVQQEIEAAWKLLEQREQGPNHRRAHQLSQNRALIRVAATLKKPIEQLTRHDVETHFPVVAEEDSDVFAHNLGLTFMRYNMRATKNRFLRWRAEDSKKADPRIVSDEVFVERFGEPPWDLVNAVIREAGLDYEVNYPDPDLEYSLPFKLKLTNISTNVEIDFTDLSSGEKILMSLGMALYNASNDDARFPKLLLLDEPDSPLHPSMTKKLLDVLRNTFVRDRGVKVVMTTHSPSTVALAPEEALYLMNRTGPRLQKVTKDRALSSLIEGVPTLSVLYENRRQVFVESENDVGLFERYDRKLRSRGDIQHEISLTFVSSGVGGKGNCDQVREVVEAIRRGGNTFIVGVVDWDLKNDPKDGVFVLGHGRRYSIESYVLDPLVLGAFLLREKQLSPTDTTVTYRGLLSSSTADIQALVDLIVGRVSANVKDVSDKALESSNYVGTPSVSVPRWYFRTPGHSLEGAVVAAFPALNAYAKKKEGELKRAIIDRVIDDNPELVPMEIRDLLGQLQQR